MIYYNQMLRQERMKKAQALRKKQNNSFASKQVDFKEFLFVPQNFAAAAYLFYIVAVPYIAGALFLFLAVAGANFEHFKLLNLNAFPIVWLIGYEIVAVVALFWILMLYLKHEPQ